MSHLIGISGKMGTGKDEIANMFQRISAPQGTYTRQEASVLSLFEIKKFAYKVKEIASLLTGIPVEKFEDQEFKKTNLPLEWNTNKMIDEGKWVNYPRYESVPMTVRELLQKVGTDAIRDGLHKNAWVNALMSSYKPTDNWLVTDVRFPNEAEAIIMKGGIVIRVNRDLDTSSDKHPSEIALDDFKYFNYTIDNNGSLKDLKTKVEQIWKEQKQLQSSS